ncbi:MAG: dockerin type I repeat-containing protein [Ruminococcus sp.]|nr:dockerin type I repeat-containing protein [Ruminococcus sp.]
MKKTMIRMAMAVLTAAGMLTPMTANAIYTEISFESERTSLMLKGYTEINDCFIRDDRIFMNEDGTHFIAFHKLRDEVMFTKADGVERQDIEELIRKHYAAPVFLTESFFGDWEKSFAVANADLKMQTEICELLKEKGMITDCTLITEKYSMADWYGRSVTSYYTWYLKYVGGELFCEENGVPKKYSTIDALSEYAKNELDGYTVREIEDDKEKTTYVELVPPEETTLLEQVEVATKIANDLEIYPFYESPETAAENVEFGTSIDLFNAVKGDANCDGKTTVADSVAILQHIACRDKYELKPQGLINADVDGVAGVTANDARVIQEWDANK